MRMNVAKSCFVRLVSWIKSEASDNRERRNKESTYRELQEMLDMTQCIMDGIKTVQAKIYPDRVAANCDAKSTMPATPAMPATLTVSEQVTWVTAMMAALQTAGIVPTVTQLQSAESTVTPAPDKNKSKRSDAKQSSGNESTDIVPKLSDAAKAKKDKKSDSQDQRKWINWRDLLEEYSVAINNLNNETFDLYDETVCAEYLKRWMDALKVGFKRKEGQIHFGADKIAEAIPKFILVITQAIQDDTLSEFDEDFKRWELRARGEDTTVTADKQSFGLPYIVASLCDPDNIKKYANNELANNVYRDFLDGSLSAVSRVKHGAEHYEYLETTAISTLLKDAA